ncbi:MAG: putative integral membrane protein (TIGR02206 family) [Verrucomicrobiales bacterium]|jgi:hypothetical integral membrane protein (TIGR02206 family)
MMGMSITPCLATSPEFVRFGSAHITVLVLTVAFTVGMIVSSRKWKDHRFVCYSSAVLAWVLLFSHPVKIVTLKVMNLSTTDQLLPLHLCNCVAVLAFVALKFRHQLAAELVYFWGLAATLQAVITPSVQYGFPHPTFFVFFVAHSGVVVAALYLVFGLGMKPRKHAVWRAWGWLQVYVIVAASVNLISGSNYGFLRAKPLGGSLFDVMGPWPYYIIGLELVSLVAFSILYIPILLTSRSKPSSRLNEGDMAAF